MFKNVVITIAFFVALVVSPVSVHAQDVSAALSRMDTIITEMEKLRVEFAKLAQSVNTNTAGTPAVLGASAKKTLTMDLSNGATNEDIARIQRLLATDKEIYPYGVDSGFFGPKTEEAIRNLQTRFGFNPVGVIGPATTALLEVFFNAYPDEKYPVGVLKSKPQVLGASTSGTPTPAPAVINSSTNPAEEINVTFDSGEALIEIRYKNGNRKGLVTDTDQKTEVVDFIVSRTTLTRVQIETVINYGKTRSSSSSNSSDADEEDADDALNDAEDAIDDAEEAIEEADDDGDDIDWADETLDEAKDLLDDAENAYDDEDWDEAVKLAEEAEDMAEKAEDRIDKEKSRNKGDNDEIDSIVAEVDEDETLVTVEYEDGDDYEFTVEEYKESKIIEEIADELDIDEDDVEDLIEFDYGKIDRIEVKINADDALARVFYKSGVEKRVRVDETDEDDIISEVADQLDERESAIEDLIEFI